MRSVFFLCATQPITALRQYGEPMTCRKDQPTPLPPILSASARALRALSFLKRPLAQTPGANQVLDKVRKSRVSQRPLRSRSRDSVHASSVRPPRVAAASTSLPPPPARVPPRSSRTVPVTRDGGGGSRGGISAGVVGGRGARPGVSSSSVTRGGRVRKP